MEEAHLELKRWTRKEYEDLVDRGIFTRRDRIELIDGLLIVAEPQSFYHYGAIRLVEQALKLAFGEGWDIRTQAPVALDDMSEPEPDVAVVPGTFMDYFTEHPSEPVLIVEVSYSSVVLDRRYKSSLYARAGRQEYWVLNLVNRTLEVRRAPAPTPSAPYGWDYADVRFLRSGDSVAALGAPASPIAIADLLPPSP